MKFIHDVKFDTKDVLILQNSSQEQLTSSMYNCVLDALRCKGAENMNTTKAQKIMLNSRCQIWYQRQSNPPKLQSETTKFLEIWLCPWCTFNHAEELKIGIQFNNSIWWLYEISNWISNMTQSSKSPVRNHQCPPSMTIFLMYC